MKIVYYIKNLINNKFIYLDGVEDDYIFDAYPFDSGYYEIVKVVHS